MDAERGDAQSPLLLQHQPPNQTQVTELNPPPTLLVPPVYSASPDTIHPVVPPQFLILRPDAAAAAPLELLNS